MKRSLLAGALLAIALTMPGAVQATGNNPNLMSKLGAKAAAPGAGLDIAYGGGTSCSNPTACASSRQFAFGAVSTPAGKAYGVYTQTLTLCTAPTVCENGTFVARVLCLSANGNVATIGGIVERSTFTLPGLAVLKGNQIVVTVYDNGRSGNPAPDALSFIAPEPVLAANGQCLNTPLPPQFTVVNGDITVRDGQL
jgi:hypothetical protein